MRRYQSDINRIMSLIYEDQPIAPPTRRPVTVIPERIRAIRSLGKGVAAYRQPREAIFLHQAKMLADYEDDYEYEREVRVWYPTYESLTDEQLRGYLGFRSRVRKGLIREESRCFAYLYIYELLNLIGCDGPQSGFEKLTDFIDRYGELDPGILPYAEQWLIDFVLYYEMEPELLRGRKSMEFDRNLARLLDAEAAVRAEAANAGKPADSPRKGFVKIRSEEEKRKDLELFQAMLFLSGLKEGQLPSLEQDSELFQAAAAGTFRGMCRHFFAKRRITLMEEYVGGEKNEPVNLFSGAVFYDASPVKGSGTCSGKRRCFDVVLSPVTQYHCEMGSWAVRTWRRNYKNQNFSELLKTIDSILREGNGSGEILWPGLQVKWIRKLIEENISSFRKEREEEEKHRIDINLDMLQGIRSSANHTMQKLMTEEDLEDEVFAEDAGDLEKNEEDKFFSGNVGDLEKNEERSLTAARRADADDLQKEKEEKPAEPKGAETPAEPEDTEAAKDFENAGRTEEFGLSEIEASLLKWLLLPDTFSKPDPGNLILSVIVDSINEKLFDEFSDLVIENDSIPFLIEDYRDELEEIVFGSNGAAAPE